MKGLFNSRRFRQGSMATAITVVVAALVVVINFVATALTERYDITLDLTTSKVFSITDETKEYLSGIEQDVVIYVLDTEDSFTARGDIFLQAVEVLKKYSMASSHIRLEYVDLVANPAFTQNYPSFQLNSTCILITSGDKARDITAYDLYEYETTMYGTSQVTASVAEQVLTSSILAVTSEKTVNVAILTGHNEDTVSTFQELLKSNNFLTGDVNLLTEDIDPSYTVAILAAPQRDYSEDELRRLDSFLTNDGEYGKTLLYFSSIEQTDLPNLEAFLADWGIRVNPGVVYETDTSRHDPDNPFLSMLNYTEDTYSASSQAAGLIPLAYFGRPLEPVFEGKGYITTQTLLGYAATAAVIINDEDTPETGTAIPHVLMGQYMTIVNSEALTSQVVAFGSSAFVEQVLLANPNIANGDFLLSMLAELTDWEDAIRIQSKDLSGVVLNISAFTALVTGVLLAIVLPLAVLIFGLVIWARRRHR